MDLFEPTIRCPLRAAVELSLDWIYDVLDASKDATVVEALSDDSEALSDGRVALSVDREAQTELSSLIDADASARIASLVTIELNPIVLNIPMVIYQK